MTAGPWPAWNIPNYTLSINRYDYEKHQYFLFGYQLRLPT
jgi:hypothetical protein